MKRVVLAMAVMAAGCGGTSIATFQETARTAKACNAVTDTCVNAGAAQCLCPTPVNSKHAKDIDDLAKSVACGGAVADCAQSTNPRCVNGMCISDIQ
jgi:hypothetical protein